MSIFGIKWPWQIVGDWIKDAAGNAFNWLLTAFHHWFLGLVAKFEHKYAQMADFHVGPWYNYWFGNALGLAQYLSISAFAVSLVAIFVPGATRRLPRAFGVAVGIAFAPMYFYSLGWMRHAEAGMAHTFSQLYHPVGQFAHQPLLLIPVVDNPLGAFTGMGGVVVLGGILLGLFYAYVYIGAAASVLLLPCFALSAVSNVAYKTMNILLSLLFLTMLTGIPTTLLLLALSKSMSEHTTALNDPFGLTASVWGALFFALLMQGVLFYAGLKLVSPVTGKVYNRGRSQIEGKVKGDVTVKQPPPQQRFASYGRTFLVRSGAPSLADRQSTPVQSTARQQAVRAGAMALAKRVPQTALVATAAERASKKQQAPPVKSPSSPTNSGPKTGNGTGRTPAALRSASPPTDTRSNGRGHGTPPRSS